jgi:hypothetical protein
VTDIELLGILAEHLALTALPGIAIVLAGVHRGVRSVPLLLCLALAASGVTAMGVFWAYYADPTFGKVVAFVLVLGSIEVAVWSWLRGRPDPRLLRELLTPLALWMLGSAFLVFLGFAHGGTDSPLAIASTRFSHQLPGDSYIPQFYADWFYEHGHGGTPPVFPGEWLSSDRPPLQIGYVLAQRPFGWTSNGLHYEMIGIVVQQLWIVGLWALLLAARVGRLTRALAMVTVLVSDIAIVNGFYIWPKLLPAAMLLAAAALLLTPLWAEVRRSLWGAALVAALLALAMLGHGSSAFAVVPLILIAAFRALPGWRWIGVAALVGVVLVGSWSAYQSYGDPPGNRLTKWMLAGVVEIDDRSSTEAIVDSYREAGFGGALHNKAENVVAIVGGGPVLTQLGDALDAAGSGELETAVRQVRTIFFFNLLPSLGLLLIAPLAMALAWRRRRGDPLDWSFSLLCWAVVLLGCLVWALALFGSLPARAVIHQGSYLVPILAICAAAAGLRASFPRFATGFLIFNALAMLALYAPSFDPPEGSSYSLLAILIAAGALAGFVAVAVRCRDAEEGELRPSAEAQNNGEMRGVT